MTRLPTFGAALGGAVLLVATLGVSWQAAAQQQDAVAESTLLRVDLGDIPEVGMSGFSGSLGHLAEGPGTGSQTWDQRDPEGVLSYVGGWYGTPPPPTTTSGTQPPPTTSNPQPPTSTGKPPTGTPTKPDPEPTPPTKTSTERPAPTESECPCEPPPHKGRAENLARTGPAHLP